MGLPQDLSEAIEGLTAYIHNARRQVDTGSVADLSMLEETVNALCDAVQSVDGPAARLLQPQMAEMISALDALAVRLNEFIEDKQREIEEQKA